MFVNEYRIFFAYEKVKFTLELALKPQTGSRGIGLLFI
jgi:hypothetical protein